MRARTTFLAFFLASWTGCGGGDDSSTAGAGPDPASSAGPGEGGVPGITDPTAIDRAPISMTQLLAGFDGRTGMVSAKKVLFSISPDLSTSLARVTVARLDGAKAEVRTLAVKGKVPTGAIEAIAYSDGLDRAVAVVRAWRPHRIEIVTIALGDAEATVDTLAQPAPLNPDGARFTALYAKGGSSLLAVRGAELLTLTVGAQASWSAPVSGQGYHRTPSSSIALDPRRGRLVAYGKDTFDVVTKTAKFEPSIATMSLSGPYTWTEVPLGSPPASHQGPSSNYWAALDGQSPRLLAVVPIKVACGPAKCDSHTLWAANLALGSWTQVRDRYSSRWFAPFAVDDAGRRALSVSDGAVSSLGLDEASTYEDVPLAQQGDLGPTRPAAALVLGNGKILSSDAGVFRVYDPAAPAPRWDRFGAARLLGDISYRPSMTEDPDTGEVLVFGGASSNSSSASSDLYALAKDGAALTKVAATGASPARVGHGAALVGRALVIVGGAAPDALAPGLDDVWTFDRTAAAWKKIAALPKPLSFVTARGAAQGQSEILAIGYAKAVGGSDLQIAPLVAIDVAAGSARELTTEGDAPKTLWSIAPLGTCFVGFESGNTVDGSEPQLWRCKRAGDVVRWEKAPIDAGDNTLGGAFVPRGAGAPDGSKAYFVGPTMWLAAPRSPSQ